MEEKTSQNNTLNITSPSIIYIIKTIKEIQKRMKDPDIINEEYIYAYNKLSSEFSDFIEKYGYINIFTKVLKGEDLSNIACILYYKDKVQKGLMTESALSELISKKFLPENLKKESDIKLKEMREKNIL